jgi:hypothetical protein
MANIQTQQNRVYRGREKERGRGFAKLWRCQLGPEGGGGGAVWCRPDGVHRCNGDGVDPTVVEPVREAAAWTQQRRSSVAWTRWHTPVRRQRRGPDGRGGGAVRRGPNSVH